jgi:O-antigen/teichoic acid export membrane protein
MILFCGIILFTNITGHTMQIEWFVYVQTFSYLLASIIIFGVVKHYSGHIKLSFHRSFFIIFLRKSYPYAILILLMSLYTRLDSVLIERLLPVSEGKAEAGIYARAYRLLEAVSNFGVLFAGLLLPIFSRMLKKREDIRPMLRFSFLLIIAPAILLAFSSWFFRGEIMDVLYHHHTSQSPLILGLLMFTFISIATTYIFGTLLTAKGTLTQLNILAGGGVMLNLSLNLFLIPKIMAVGAAWAALVTQSAMALSQVILVYYLFRFPPDFKLIFRILFYTIAIFILGVFCSGWQNWLHGYLTMLAGGILLAFGTGLIRLKTLKTILTEQ